MLYSTSAGGIEEAKAPGVTSRGDADTHADRTVSEQSRSPPWEVRKLFLHLLPLIHTLPALARTTSCTSVAPAEVVHLRDALLRGRHSWTV